MHAFSRLPFALLVLATLALASCGSHPNVPLADRCSEQIMLSLAPGVGRTERVMGDIEEGAGVQLDYLRAASPTLFVYRLRAPGRDPDCLQALSRLRHDSRVRFAESDERRTAHGFAK